MASLSHCKVTSFGIFIGILLLTISPYHVHAANETAFSYDPAELTLEYKGSSETINVNVTLNSSIIQDIRYKKIDAISISCRSETIAPENKQVIEITDGQQWNFTDFQEQLQDENEPLVFNFTTKGTFIGHAKVTFDVYAHSRRSGELISIPTDNNTHNTYEVDVIRKDGTLDHAFRGFMILFVMINYVNMGCAMDMEIVKQTLRKPIGPVIGVICQFTVMPLASYALGYILFPDQLGWRLGLFALGCSPGGSASNFWTLLLNGDMDLSITMTFISTILAVGMMPLWLYTLGRTIVHDNQRIEIPYQNICFSLVYLTVPLILGLLIKRFKPTWAAKSKKFIKPFTVIVVAIIVIFTSIAYVHLYLMFTWKIVVAGAGVTILGYGLGALAAAAFRLPCPQIIAISIETAFQNSGIAFILLLMSFKQPEADISSVPCVAQVILTSQPLWLVFIGMKIWSCMKQRRLKNDQGDSCGEPDPTTLPKDDAVDISHITHSGPRRCPLRPPMKTEDAVKLNPDEVSAVHVRI